MAKKIECDNSLCIHYAGDECCGLKEIETHVDNGDCISFEKSLVIPGEQLLKDIYSMLDTFDEQQCHVPLNCDQCAFGVNDSCVMVLLKDIINCTGVDIE